MDFRFQVTKAQQPAKKTAARRPPLAIDIALQNLYVFCLPALRSLYDIELYGLTFLQAAEALRLDRRVMNEDILAILARNEAIAFSVVEPLHCSLFHECCNSLCFDIAFRTGGCYRQVPFGITC